ncbi:hypothetical protein D3C86_1417300 [compost metagenome]
MAPTISAHRMIFHSDRWRDTSGMAMRMASVAMANAPSTQPMDDGDRPMREPWIGIRNACRSQAAESTALAMNTARSSGCWSRSSVERRLPSSTAIRPALPPVAGRRGRTYWSPAWPSSATATSTQNAGRKPACSIT